MPGQLVEEGQQPMAKWNPPANIFYPNIARTWEVSDDGLVFTLNLRHGMKWSDGEDLDADDFVFFYEAILANEEINAVTPEPRGRYRPGGELMKLRVVDRYTVEYTFAAPYHNAAESGWARGRSFAPEHHLGKYHLGVQRRRRKCRQGRRLRDLDGCLRGAPLRPRTLRIAARGAPLPRACPPPTPGC